MKIHTNELRDRYAISGKFFLRVAGGREVRVREEDISEAAQLYGGDSVAYRLAGPHAIFVPDHEREGGET